MVSDTIQFLLNDKIYKIKNPDPNKTILNYVRNDLKKLVQRKAVLRVAVELVQLFSVN